MAPEQVEHPQRVDHRADIYSLGVVFYEMLTGDLPRGQFAPPSRTVQVDVRLDEVVLKALEKAPERRYQHASEVKTAVETIAATERVAAPAAPPHALPDRVTNGPSVASRPGQPASGLLARLAWVPRWLWIVLLSLAVVTGALLVRRLPRTKPSR